MANVLLHLLPVLWLLNAVHTSSDCSMKRTSSLRFRAKSGVNELGQRTVSVEALGEALEADTVGVSVDHWTAICDDMQVVGLQLNVTGPNSNIDTPAVPELTTEQINVTTVGAVPTVTVASSIATERQVVTTERPISALPSKLGYTLMSGIGCYKGNHTYLTWDAARLSCEAEGAHLATPDSEQELDAMETIRMWAGKWSSWVGVHKMKGVWQTVEGIIMWQSVSHHLLRHAWSAGVSCQSSRFPLAAERIAAFFHHSCIWSFGMNTIRKTHQLVSALQRSALEKSRN